MIPGVGVICYWNHVTSCWLDDEGVATAPLGTRNRNHPTGFNLCVFECFWLRVANSNKIRLLLQLLLNIFLWRAGRSQVACWWFRWRMVDELVQLVVVLLQFQPHLLLFSCFCGLTAFVIECLRVHQFSWQLSHVFLFFYIFPGHNELKSICLPVGFLIKRIKKCKRKLWGTVPFFLPKNLWKRQQMSR